MTFSGNIGPRGLTFLGAGGMNVSVPADHPKFSEIKGLFRDTQIAFRDKKADAATLLTRLTTMSKPSAASAPTAKAAASAKPKAKSAPAPTPTPPSFMPPASEAAGFGIKLGGGLGAMQEMMSAESMMKLAAMSGNHYGFETGVENYAQARWGVDGLNAALTFTRTQSYYYERDKLMAEFKTDSSAFFRVLEERLFPTTMPNETITVTALDGSKVELRHDQVGTIIGEDERDRDEFLKPGAKAGIYLMENYAVTGTLLQVQETPSEVADAVNALTPGVSFAEMVNRGIDSLGDTGRTNPKTPAAREPKVKAADRYDGSSPPDENKLVPGVSIQFREDFARGQVRVLVLDGNKKLKEVNRFNEYKTAAEWTQRRYNLSDSDLDAIYRDYKEDYDS